MPTIRLGNGCEFRIMQIYIAFITALKQGVISCKNENEKEKKEEIATQSAGPNVLFKFIF